MSWRLKLHAAAERVIRERAGGPVRVSYSLHGATPHEPATVAWFGADGERRETEFTGDEVAAMVGEDEPMRCADCKREPRRMGDTCEVLVYIDGDGFCWYCRPHLFGGAAKPGEAGGEG
jgi:hypothetical protein